MLRCLAEPMTATGGRLSFDCCIAGGHLKDLLRRRPGAEYWPTSGLEEKRLSSWPIFSGTATSAQGLTSSYQASPYSPVQAQKSLNITTSFKRLLGLTTACAGS